MAFDRGSPYHDGGAAWQTSLGVSGETVSSANASVTPLVITDAPATGQRICLDDVEISVDTTMTVTVRTTTDSKVVGKYYLSANTVTQLTPRGQKKGKSGNDRTLEVLTSIAGNIAVTALYHSET